MKMTAMLGSRRLSCALSAAGSPEISFREVSCDLLPESVTYAVCRLFSRSESLCRTSVPESYACRLTGGRDRRPRRRQIVLPAGLAELPGVWARVSFQVGPEGVTITGVTLSRRFPFSGRDGAGSRSRSAG